jgi:membrane protease YdiL (CAAX protease family)
MMERLQSVSVINKASANVLVYIGISTALSGLFVSISLPDSIALFLSVIVATIVAILPVLMINRGLLTEQLRATNGKMSFGVFSAMFVLTWLCGFVMSGIFTAIDTAISGTGISFISSYDTVFSDMGSPSMLIYAILIGPICEELVFRGAVMKMLEKIDVRFAMIVSSLMFALMHGIVFQIVAVFPTGMLLAFVARKYSLKWSIALHIFTNSLSTIADIAPFGVTGFTGIVFLVMIVVGVITLIVKRRRVMYYAKRFFGTDGRLLLKIFKSPVFDAILVYAIILCVLSTGFLE